MGVAPRECRTKGCLRGIDVATLGAPVPFVVMNPIKLTFMLYGAAVGVFVAFVPVILATRGFSPADIGLTTAAAAAVFTIAIPVWGHLADVVLGRRLALGVTGLGAAVFAVLVAVGGSPLQVVVCFLGFTAFSCAWASLCDALAVNATPNRSGDYARIRLRASFGFAVAATAAGFLYNQSGYWPSYFLCAGLALAVAAGARLVPDVRRADLAAFGGGSVFGSSPSRGGSFVLALRIQPRVRGILLAVFLIHAGVLGTMTFLALRIVDLGGRPSDVALSAAVGAFAEIPGMLLAAPVARRIGLRGLFATSTLVYAVCMASWAVIDSPALIIATRLITGPALAGLWVGSVLTMTVLFPPRLQATGQGLYQVTSFGVASALANALGGLLYGSMGPAVVFCGAAVLGFAAVGVALVTLPRRGETPMLDEDAAPIPFPVTASG